MSILHPNMRRVLAIFALLLASSAANAQATRTWVSGVGDDVNPCSRTAPCKTFAGAISKTAAGGTISVLDPGGFGAVTITKSLTIEGLGFTGSILATGTNGITVNAASTDVVTIRDLAIYGGGTGFYGIRFIGGGQLHVEHCRISGFHGSAGTGIYVGPTTVGARKLFVQDTTITNNGTGSNGGGIVAIPSGGAIVIANVDNSVISDNSGYGVRVYDSAYFVISHSHISGNQLSGIYSASGIGDTDVILRDNVFNDDGWDQTTTEAAVLSWGANSFVHISGNTITDSEYGLRRISGGLIISYGDNKVLSNTNNGTPSSTATNL